MSIATYLERRGELETYFDRTAVDAWAKLTSDAPVGRIRATVRAGRDEMRNTLLSWLPQNMSGARLLDAGCGTGALSIEAARRGARVTMLTNKPLHHTARIVDALGWTPLFDEVVGGDNPLGRKPEPHALLAMMSAAGVAAAQAMLVGDSKVDLDTARRAGVRCCLVSFGYDFESVDKAPIEGETIVKDVATLVREIEAFL